MNPREKDEPVPSHDSYGTMSDSGANESTNIGMAPLGSARIANTLNNGEYETNHQSHGNAATIENINFVPIDVAIEKVGTGVFQYKILLATGLCFMADAMEVLLLTFLSTVLKYEWNLSEHQVDSIVAIVFAGAMMGTLVLGRAADYWGRKPVFAVTASLIAIAGVATAFCRTYKELIIARFWVGFGVGGLTVPFDCLSEFLPGAARGKNLLYIGKSRLVLSANDEQFKSAQSFTFFPMIGSSLDPIATAAIANSDNLDVLLVGFQTLSCCRILLDIWNSIGPDPSIPYARPIRIWKYRW